ncbi:MAG: flagellar motor switch protein FliM [Clostridiales bacterium]|nr:flagellar motor switch protein FliM [Clostridiales bacterium]
MAEVLSQSQIDALLNSMRSGGEDRAEEKQPEKKYRKYDFTTPRKFTKDRIKMLNGIFENYTRVVSSRLNAQLRTNCEIEVESIEEQKFYEFNNALMEGDVLAMVNVTIHPREENGRDVQAEDPVMVYLSTSTALGMMDRMMGSEGEAERDVPIGYAYTDLELQLYEHLLRDIVALMGSSWENYVPVTFEYERTQVNPTLVSLLNLDETVVLVDMKLTFGGSEGRMSIVLPGNVLMSVFGEVNRESMGRKVASEDNSEEIFSQLRDSTLEIIAALGDTQLSLSDIYHLNVGDVVDLGRSKDSPVFLEIGGYQWFTGRMGTHKKNMAIKIDEVCYSAEQRSE